MSKKLCCRSYCERPGQMLHYLSKTRNGVALRHGARFSQSITFAWAEKTGHLDIFSSLFGSHCCVGWFWVRSLLFGCQSMGIDAGQVIHCYLLICIESMMMMMFVKRYWESASNWVNVLIWLSTSSGITLPLYPRHKPLTDILASSTLALHVCDLMTNINTQFVFIGSLPEKWKEMLLL